MNPGDRMSILHISPRYYPIAGGSEQYCQEMSESLVRDGHQVTVLTTNAWDIEFFWDPHGRHFTAGGSSHNGVSIHRFAVQHLLWTKWSYAVTRGIMTWLASLPIDASSLLFRLCRWLPRVPGLNRQLANGPPNTYDIVHATNIPADSMVSAAFRYATRHGLPFVLTPFVHLGEPHDETVRRYYTMPHQVLMMQKSDRIIVQTDLERDHLSSLGVPTSTMRKVGVGVSPEKLGGGSGARFREKRGLRTPIVFYIGVQAYDKGTVHLVEAMKRLWQQDCQAELVLAGSMLSSFAQYMRSLPDWVRQRCHLLGFIPEDEKRDLLDAGDVFVMPSRTDSFGIVYLEAWLYRKPVIGALAGGVPEVIHDGEDGFLVPFGDVPRLAEAIRTLLSDGAMAARFGARGYETAVGHSWKRKCAAIKSIYSELCGANPQPSP